MLWSSCVSSIVHLYCFNNKNIQPTSNKKFKSNLKIAWDQIIGISIFNSGEISKVTNMNNTTQKRIENLFFEVAF